MNRGALVIAFSALVAIAAGAHDAHTVPATVNVARPLSTNATAAARSATATNLAQLLPPLPDGVSELKFQEFYKPIGKRGLEFSEKARQLDGKRVRVLGYMIRQSAPVPHQFLLAPMPLALQEEEYGFAEDMPATLLHVTVPTTEPERVPFTPGLMLLTGVLSIGNRPEPDGRVSSIRLKLDKKPESRNDEVRTRTEN